jgi:hypothetical protein
MDASEDLMRDLRFLLYNISAHFMATMAPYVEVRPHASLQRLKQDLMVMPRRLRPLVATAASTFPSIRHELAQDFANTVRVLYYGLRAAESRVMAGTGRQQGRPTDTCYADAFRRGAFCVLTGLTKEDGVKYELAHIVPWSVARWHDGRNFSFYRLINKLFGDDVGALAFALSGGRNANNIENLMTLSPDMHKLYDSGVLRLKPTTDGNGRQSFTVIFRKAPRHPWFWTIVNGDGCVPLRHDLVLTNNPAGCGNADLHNIINWLEWLGQGFRFNKEPHGDRSDLGGLWRENFV